MMRTTYSGLRICISVLCMFAVPLAFAQYQSDFESLSASSAGTILTGQDGYFLPNGAASDEDFLAYTYSGNALGLPQNPSGGDQFIGGTGPAGGRFARAQRFSDFIPTGLWTAGFDLAITFTGQLPTVQNIGSFSLNEGVPGVFSIINLARWVDPATATGWNADMVWFDGAGNQLLEQVPDANFQNLAVNHWYRWETDFSLDTNQVFEMRLTDLTTGNVSTHNPADRWLRPGANPDHHRFFAGGGVPASQAQREVVELAEMLSIPVATSLAAKSTITDNHPLSVGVVGSYSRWCANRVGNDADLGIFIGSHTGSQVTNEWRVPAAGTPVIQIDIDPSELGRSYTNEVSLHGDA